MSSAWGASGTRFCILTHDIFQIHTFYPGGSPIRNDVVGILGVQPIISDSDSQAAKGSLTVFWGMGCWVTSGMGVRNGIWGIVCMVYAKGVAICCVWHSIVHGGIIRVEG